MTIDQTPIITVISLRDAFLEAPFLSSEILEVIRDTKRSGKKSLIFYNRRGSARAWICQDCGFFEKCPHCDIAFAYHTSPKPRLICHQCNALAPFPIHCPSCQGSHIAPVGVGIQKIEADLKKLLPDFSILRIDSDRSERSHVLFGQMDSADIILGTQMLSTLVDPRIGACIFLSFDANLSLPEYDTEETLFDEILYYKKQNLPLYIQTYTPLHPLLADISTGTINTFLHTLAGERKQFLYPPFAEFAILRIHDLKKERVQTMVAHLVHKIQSLKKEETFLAYDRDISEKRGGEWTQKIILKDTDLSYIIGQLEVEVVRNRAVTLEWA